MDKNILTFILVIAGSCLAIGSAYIQYMDKKGAELEAKNSKKEASDANIKILSLNEDIRKKADELIEANKKINELTNETLKSALGDGFLKVDLLRVQPDEYQFVVINNSNYPIYDVSIEFIDFDEVMKCQHEKIDGKLTFLRECFQKSVTRFENINFIPNTERYFPNRFKFVNGYKHFYIKIHSRNSSTVRQCIFKEKKDGLWDQSYRFYQYKNSLIKKIDEKNTIGVSESYWIEHFTNTIDLTLSGYQ